MDGQQTSLAEKILHTRRSLKESQEDFGKRFGVKQRSTVAGWEAGTPPNADHLTKLTQFFEDQEEAQGEGLRYQLLLPFDEPVNFAFRVSPSPHSADRVRFEVEIRRKAG